MLNASLQGAVKFRRNLERSQKQISKSFQTAVRVEAFRLTKELKAAIRSGDPGGKPFKPLTFLARRKGKRFKPNKPLARLALPISYHVAAREPYTVNIGWTGPRVSRSWKQIAEAQQTGFTRRISPRMERYFMHRGDELSRRSRNRKFFFMRPSTETFTTPARPILQPFWKRNEAGAWRNISSNFKRKLRGERI